MVDKVRENRLRRMAERQGYVLEKSRRRDRRARDFGRYRLIADHRDARDQENLGYPHSMDDVEQFLTEHEEAVSDL
jgi:hypothetical protein